MQAIILAAGMGKRLGKLTKNNTKCMVKVNGVPLIDRMLSQIEQCSVERIIIVTGYESEKLCEYIDSLDIRTPIVYVNNPDYNKTNNIYSLSLVSDYLCSDDTILLESDIIFEDSVLKELVNDPRPDLALADRYEAWMDGTCLRLDENDNIIEVVSKKDFAFNRKSEYYKTVNIYKFSKEFSSNYYVPFLKAYQKALGENEYYEQVLRVITVLDKPVIKAKRLSKQKWYEIDDIQDLDIAESIFAPDTDTKINLIQQRYGGYWRYPGLLDFCYLVNPYFPPQKMIDEINANSSELIRNYPSGMRINSLLASKMFGVDRDYIVIGNGAAELINHLMHIFNGKTGFVRPTFEEYPNRYVDKDSVCFWPDNNDFSYSETDLIDFFIGRDIKNLVIINPDNPSGNYIKKAGLIRLADWCEKQNVNLIIDESFADFAEEIDNTLIDQNLLEKYPNLFVVKSISKSYGVPGLRLGVIASGNKKLIEYMKKEVSIWNINSFAEFFMQIIGKYSQDYKNSLDMMRKERKRFCHILDDIDGVRVVQSQANFVMLEIISGINVKNIQKKMLCEHDILIKELTKKTNGGNYLRVAIRDEADNDVFAAALEKEIKEEKNEQMEGNLE